MQKVGIFSAFPSAVKCLNAPYRNSSEQRSREAHDHHLVLQVTVVIQQVRQVEEVHPSRSYGDRNCSEKR